MLYFLSKVSWSSKHLVGKDVPNFNTPLSLLINYYLMNIKNMIQVLTPTSGPSIPIPPMLFIIWKIILFKIETKLLVTHLSTRVVSLCFLIRRPHWAIAVKTMGHQFHNGHQQDRILKLPLISDLSTVAKGMMNYYLKINLSKKNKIFKNRCTCLRKNWFRQIHGKQWLRICDNNDTRQGVGVHTYSHRVIHST